MMTDLENMSNEDLVDLARGDDEEAKQEAFSALMLATEPMRRRWAERSMKNPATATYSEDDAMANSADAVIKAVASYDRNHPSKAKFNSWLYGKCRRRLDHRARGERPERHVSYSQMSGDGDEGRQWEPSVEGDQGLYECAEHLGYSLAWLAEKKAAENMANETVEEKKSGTDRLYDLLRATWGDGEEIVLAAVASTYQAEMKTFFPRRSEAQLGSSLRTAIQTLVKRGTVRRVKRGVYVLVGGSDGDE